MNLQIPSNRTLILGAVCLSLVAGIGAYKIGEARRVAIQTELKKEGAVYIDLQKTNSDGALLQNALKNINLDATLGTSTDPNPFSPSPNDTLTDTLTKNLFLSYANQQNGTDSRTDDEVANNLIGQIDTSGLPQAVYSLANVKMFSPRTNEEIKQYGNQVGAILKANYMVISNKKDAIKLKEIGQIHKKIGAEMIAISTPTPIAQMHLAMANDYALLGAAFEIIATEEQKDPLKSLLAIRTAKDAAENMDKMYEEINSYFAKNGILFSNNEPGLVWSQIVLK